MLPRAASQAFARRGALLPVRRATFAPLQWSRLYAKDDKPRPFADETDIRKSPQDLSRRGPVQNRTWSPDAGVKFASDGPQYSSPSSLSTNTDIPSKQAETPAQSPPSSNAPRRSSKLGSVPPTSASSPTTETATNSSTQRDLNVDGTEPETAKTPLPDLTKGIPSTFESEFLSQNKTAARDGQEDQHPELDITESHATEGGNRQGGGGSSDGGRRQKEEYVSSIDRRRNAMMRYTMIGGAAFAVVGAFFLGQNWADAEEEARHSDAPNGYLPGQFYARIKARLNEMFGYYTEPAFPKLLPTVDPAMAAPLTLVMSLEDLLVSSKWTPQKGWQVAKRPGMDYFVRYLSQYYELVLFTTVASMNADLVLKKLDPFRIIAYPLFREATRYINGDHVKDLSYLNRDLSKTVIIDTVKAHTQLQPENAIILPKWSGDPKDAHTNDLVALIPFLEYIATMGIQDVRTVLKSYEGTHIPTEFARREAKAREAFNKQLAEEKRKRGKVGSITGGLSGMLGIKPSTGLMQIPGEPSLAEALAQGKMLSDQIRERGQRTYLAIEKDIRENGEGWLKEAEAEEKKMMEEAAKSMQGNVRGTFGFFGGGGGEKK